MLDVTGFVRERRKKQQQRLSDRLSRGDYVTESKRRKRARVALISADGRTTKSSFPFAIYSILRCPYLFILSAIMLASSASRSALTALRSASAATSAARPSTASALFALPPLTRSYAKVRPSKPPRPPHTNTSQAEKVPKDAKAAEAEAQSHAREETPVQPEAPIIEAEQSQQQQAPTRRSTTSAFDIDTTLATIADEAAEGGKPGKRTGARARSDYSQSSIEKQRSNTRKILLLLTTAGVGFTLFQMSRDWDTVKDRERFAEVSNSSSRPTRPLDRKGKS